MNLSEAEYWMSRCASCLDYEYDDETLGKCIYFEYCKNNEVTENNNEK